MHHPTGNRRHRRCEGSGIIELVLDAWRTLVRISMALRRPRKTMKRRPSLRRRPESRGRGMDTAPNRDITDPYVPKCSIQELRLWTPPVMCGNRCIRIDRGPISSPLDPRSGSGTTGLATGFPSSLLRKTGVPKPQRHRASARHRRFYLNLPRAVIGITSSRTPFLTPK